jgi:hypothetical protein
LLGWLPSINTGMWELPSPRASVTFPCKASYALQQCCVAEKDSAKHAVPLRMYGKIMTAGVLEDTDSNACAGLPIGSQDNAPSIPVCTAPYTILLA